MLTWARCMVGLHQWEKKTRDGVPYKECRNCDKWKRVVKYGGTPRPFDGGGGEGAAGRYEEGAQRGEGGARQGPRRLSGPCL